MKDIGSHNIQSCENEFPNVGEIKKDLELCGLQQDIQLSLAEGENFHTHHVTENSILNTLLVTKRITKNLSTLEN